jgi:hypothetical protein
MDVAEGKLTLTAEDLNRAIADMPENVRARRAMTAYALLLMLAGLGSWLMEVRLELRVLWVALGVGLIVYGQFLARSAGRRLIAGMKEGERDVSYRFDAEGVNIQTPVSEVALRYGALHRQREVSTAFLLYTQQRIAQVVPKRAFDAAQIERIRHWLGAAVEERPQPRTFLRPLAIWAVLIVTFLVVWLWLAPHGG